MHLSQTRIIQIALFTIALTISACASIFYAKPVGADIWFHLDIVKVYLAGGNGMFAANVMAINRIPYPPLFHMLLLPSVALGVGNEFARVLQTFIYPGCLLATLLLIERYGFGKTHMLVSGFALLGSFAYVDATFQIRPESLDMIFWLIFAYALLSAKGKLTVASVVAGVYNHSFPVLAHTGGPLLWNRNRKQILAITVISLPILIISAVYLASFTGKWFMTPASPQAASFLNNTFTFSLIYLGSLAIGIPVAVYSVLKWHSLTQLSKISLLTIASSLLLIPLWYDRFYQYVSIPLAILTGEFAVAVKSPWRWYVLLFVGAFAVSTLSTLWVSNMNGLWDIH